MDKTTGANPNNLCLQIRDKIGLGRDPRERRVRWWWHSEKAGGSAA